MVDVTVDVPPTSVTVEVPPVVMVVGAGVVVVGFVIVEVVVVVASIWLVEVRVVVTVTNVLTSEACWVQVTGKLPTPDRELKKKTEAVIA